MSYTNNRQFTKQLKLQSIFDGIKNIYQWPGFPAINFSSTEDIYLSASNDVANMCARSFFPIMQLDITCNDRRSTLFSIEPGLVEIMAPSVSYQLWAKNSFLDKNYTSHHFSILSG